MGLQPATRLGPYEIISAIGAGGMGEVYRARDTRLGRTVAIKVLSEHLSGSSQIRERFDREAKAIASLSHPHICPLYDVGQQDATDFLVMEYVDGETLARRLERGPLRTEQVLQYAIQLTDALDTADRHGVIHRDLKPGNIMITAEGIKLLDFGLAKMSRAEPVAGLTAALTEPAPLTIEGAILGTLHYMAPEQLEGTEADARSDIFALGVVIYEMVTGRKAFNGKNPASVISAIMTAEPASIISIQPAVLPALDHVVRMCLAKAPDARWQTAHDVLIELKWILETGLRAGTAEQFISGRREVFAWAVAGILLLALGAVSAIHFNQRVVEEHPVRFAVRLPEQVTQYFFDMPVVSPNGQRLAFTGASADGRRLMWIRSLDSAAAEPLAGTEDAYFPFWSPDSHFIAFCTGDQKLKKIDVSGGPVEIIADASFPCGGSWNRDGVILFASKSVLQRVSAAGGDLKPVRELDKLRQEISQNWPHFLPDGRHYLYSSHSADASKSGIYVSSLDSQDTRLLIASEANVSYASPGFLIYGRQETLMAQPFNAGRLRITGEPFSIAEHVGSVRAISLFSVSQTGVLVYRAPVPKNVRLASYTREGKRLAWVGQPGTHGQIYLSPDEKQVLLERFDQQSRTDLWILSLSSGIFSRFTFSFEHDPIWSPDGREVLFAAARGGKFGLYRKPVGGGDEAAVYLSDEPIFPYFWSTDGKWILSIARQGTMIYQLPLESERKPVVLTTFGFGTDEFRLSPDGRWIAYNSVESGRWETYIAAFPTFREKRQVSDTGGCQPLWRKDGKELFYLTLDGKLMVVSVNGGNPLQTGKPMLLFQTPAQVSPRQSQYCMTGDGKKFLFLEPVGERSADLNVVLNWTAGLNR